MKKELLIKENELMKLVKEYFDCECVIEIFEDEDENIKDVVALIYNTNEFSKILMVISEHLNICSSDIIVQANKEGTTTFLVDFIDLKTLLENLYETSLSGEYTILNNNKSKGSVIKFTIR